MYENATIISISYDTRPDSFSSKFCFEILNFEINFKIISYMAEKWHFPVSRKIQVRYDE